MLQLIFSFVKIAILLIVTVPSEGFKTSNTVEKYPITNSLHNQLNSFKTPELKNAVVKPTEEVEKLNKKIDCFKSVLKTIIKNTEAIPGVGSFVAVLNSWVDHFTPQQGVWDVISLKVDFAIERKITNHHYDTLQGHWDEFISITKEIEIGKKHFISILNKKSWFFPQTFWNTFEFTPKKIGSTIVGYVTYFTTILLEAIKRKEMNVTDFKYLDTLRGEVIEAAKTMHRKRYQNLIGTDSTVAIFDSAKLSFEDPYSGNTYSTVLSHVKSEIFDKIMSDTSDILMEYMVNKVNLFFNKTLCENYCPKPITKNDIQFQYDRNCYGIQKDSKQTCALPCHNYAKLLRDDWCSKDKGVKVNRIWTSTEFKDTYYAECKKIDWSDRTSNCMPLNRVKGTLDKKI